MIQPGLSVTIRLWPTPSNTLATAPIQEREERQLREKQRELELEREREEIRKRQRILEREWEGEREERRNRDRNRDLEWEGEREERRRRNKYSEMGRFKDLHSLKCRSCLLWFAGHTKSDYNCPITIL
jgi:hypothetical protein